MEDSFKVDIISPEKIIFSETSKLVKIPSYEGDMSILINHIPIITFLRPGIVKIEKRDGNFEEFFAQGGAVEFFENNLTLLSSSVENIKNLSKEFIDNLFKETQTQLDQNDISDDERYILNHKLDVIKHIRI